MNKWEGNNVGEVYRVSLVDSAGQVIESGVHTDDGNDLVIPSILELINMAFAKWLDDHDWIPQGWRVVIERER